MSEDLALHLLCFFFCNVFAMYLQLFYLQCICSVPGHHWPVSSVLFPRPPNFPKSYQGHKVPEEAVALLLLTENQ